MSIADNDDKNKKLYYVSMGFGIAANWGHLKCVAIIRTMYKVNFKLF